MPKFIGKKGKDTEAASETIVFNCSFLNSALLKAPSNLSPGVTAQQLLEESFDNELEKRK